MSPGASPSQCFLEAAGELVRSRTGLVFLQARRSAFEAGLLRAMHRAQVTEADVYLARVEAESTLLEDLVGEITVGETYFFRDVRQFAAIREEIVPALAMSRSPAHELRLWSAGCASGEEAYSLAIIMRELGLEKATRIVATDLSRAALHAARRALYTHWSFRGVSEHVMQTYFKRVGSRFELLPAVRETIEFRYLNLAENAYPSLSGRIWGMDLILCRNVLIYFDAVTVAQVARRLIDSLSDDGWLLLGASDPLLGDLVPCEVVLTGAGLAYRRPRRRTPRERVPTVGTPTLPLSPQPEPPPTPHALTPVLSGPDAPDGPARAAQWYAERDYKRAAELAARLVQQDGRDPMLWVVLIRALANQGELKAAGQACAAALDCHRTSAELTYLHALLLEQAGRYDEAARAARRALYLDRRLIVAHLLLAASEARLGDVKRARRAVCNAQRLLEGMAPDEIVPASDGESAGRLAAIASLRMRLLSEVGQ